MIAFAVLYFSGFSELKRQGKSQHDATATFIFMYIKRKRKVQRLKEKGVLMFKGKELSP